MKNTDVSIAKSLLGQDGIVFVIVKNGDILFSSLQKGIQPFFDAWTNFDPEELINCSIADKLVGKAALMLAAYFGVKDVYTPLASKYAMDAALDLDLDLEAEEVVPYIVNRTKDGMCPMEKAVLEISNPIEAFETLKITMEKLNKSKE